jgi:Uncharacterized protein conserved in bacteria (DUF2171)
VSGDARPVSWLVLEPGWEVVDRDGVRLGTVGEVLGDPDHDIFDGLEVSTGMLRPSRYVPAAEVAAIAEGRVELALTGRELERLGDGGRPAGGAGSG